MYGKAVPKPHQVFKVYSLSIPSVGKEEQP